MRDSGLREASRQLPGHGDRGFRGWRQLRVRAREVALRVVILASLVVVSAVHAKPARLMLRGALLDVEAGPSLTHSYRASGVPLCFHAEALSLAAGLRFGERWGVSIGTALACGDIEEGIGVLPVTANLSYDLTPDSRWRRAVAYAGLTYSHSNGDPFAWIPRPWPAYLLPRVGISYTLYAVTPHFDVSYQPVGRGCLRVSLGIAVPGGPYVF